MGTVPHTNEHLFLKWGPKYYDILRNSYKLFQILTFHTEMVLNVFNFTRRDLDNIMILVLLQLMQLCHESVNSMSIN